MGTNIYGSYDELVIELRGLDLVRAHRRRVRVKVDDVWQVRSADVRSLVSWDGERVLHIGAATRRRGRVLVLDLRAAAPFDRIVLAIDGADHVAADLCRWGVGAPPAPVGERVPVLVGG